jgi:ABC-2 type transport system permease protein
MWGKAFFRRLAALTRKEFYQLLRDKSSLLLGIVMPVVLILLIGYGMSLDVKNVPVAVVLEDHSPTARQAVSFVDGSEYFSSVYMTSMQEAESRLLAHEVDAILRVPVHFTADLARKSAQVQVIVNGVEATSASSAQTYIESGMLTWAAKEGIGAAGGQASVVSRIWFNDANTSTWFFVPGVIMLVLMIVGVFLTSVVMAREWERGTFESLFVTPTGVLELILAKLIPYFSVAMLGMLLCLLAGRYLYELPLRGSMILIVGVSMLFLIVALGIGLVISALTKNQFLACQVSLLVSFMPSLMLSGFMFDLHTEPWGIRLLSQAFPTTYYLQLLKSLLLAGNYWPLIIRNTLLLTGYAVFFMGLAFRLTRKKVE